MIVLVILGLIFGGILIVFFTKGLNLISDFHSIRSRRDSNSSVYMKFKDFKKMYTIKPEAYELDKDCIEYRLNQRDAKLNSYIMRILFHLFDFIRYRFWRYRLFKNKKKKQTNEKQRKAMERLLTSMQNDINDYRERTAKETSQKVQEILNPQQSQTSEVEEVESQDNTKACWHRWTAVYHTIHRP